MIPRRAFAPLRPALVIGALLLAMSNPGHAAAADAPARVFLPDTAIIAFVGDKPIVAREFTDLYESSYPEGKPRSDSLGRVQFMNSIVSKVLLANAAREANRPLTFEDRATLKEYSNTVYANRLYSLAVADSVNVTEEEARALWDCYKSRYRLRRILFARLNDAQRVRKELMTGRLGFALASKTYGVGEETVRDGDMGWYDCGRLGFGLAPLIMGLRPGQYSDLNRSDRGYELFQLMDRTAAEPPAYEGIRTYILGQVRELRAARRAEAMQLEVADRIHLKPDSVNIAFAAPHFPVASSSGARGDLNIDTSVPAFSPDEMARTLATYDGGKLTLGDFVHSYSELTPMIRPTVNDYWLLRNAVIASATSRFMPELAIARGIDKDPGVQTSISRRTEEIMVEHLYADSVESKIWVNPETRREFYEKSKRKLVTFEVANYGIIARDTRAQADSLAAELKRGLSFRAALERDSLLGRQLGSIKQVREDQPGDAMYKLVFESMKEGNVDIAGPGRDGTYFVVQCLERVPGRQLSYEESESIVDEALQNEQAEVLLAEFMGRLRSRWPVSILYDRLMHIRLIQEAP